MRSATSRKRRSSPRWAAATPSRSRQISEGETVLDLGSGGGIDVLLSARRVGPKGKAYGLDMTDEMLDLARENARKAGVTNVEFLKGEMEAMPLPDSTVDVIISNCVVNLSPDKDAVLREAYRVLTAGRPLRRSRTSSLAARCPPSCSAASNFGPAASPARFRWTTTSAKLTAAGFGDVEIETVREYTADGRRERRSGRARCASTQSSGGERHRFHQRDRAGAQARRRQVRRRFEPLRSGRRSRKDLSAALTAASE